MAHDTFDGTASVRTKSKLGKSSLGIQLLALQEDMQQRIASDLHDSTCQHLLAASLNMMRMRCAVAGIGSAINICDEIDASIGEALREIRAFTYLLHPQNLLDGGLKSAIEEFVVGLSSRTSLETRLKIDAAVDALPNETQRSLLRVVQEALANVFRHAKATQVNISIKATDTNVTLRISDNGCGMPISQARDRHKAVPLGVGIPAMRARLDQMGGIFEIHSSSTAACSGTTVYATIPRAISRKGNKPVDIHQSARGSAKIRPSHG
ncbi:sensor histidine kinase [Tardiphaga sp. 42S5]|uniref:sensor histidine kinase n=1 Tax=Tardiphaga sp. 42S5 TaxID=1404799 RepID=UPI002A59C9C7|nr:ATP-binding protein [Tardiphaga sp. 42S5]WPO41941.1 ATP-binding protein [Tardiphaga sp. 42S5]